MELGLLLGVQIKHVNNGSKTLLYSSPLRCWPWHSAAHVWKNAKNELVARSSGGTRPNGGAFFRFLKEVDVVEGDLLVACWCAYMWAISQRRLENGIS